MTARRPARAERRNIWGGLLLAAVLAAPASLPASDLPKEGGLASPPLLVSSLSEKAHFRRPEKEDMRQFYGEFARKGWRNAVIPTISTEYTLEGSSLDGAGSRLATLWGDVDGDGQAEWIVGCYFSNEPPVLVTPG